MNPWLNATLSIAAVVVAIPLGLAGRRLLDAIEAARLRAAEHRSRR